MEYNPDKLSFRDILEEWSDLDYPLMQQKTQYRSAIFTLNDEQKSEAELFVKELAAKNADKGPIYCTVEPVTKFYRGEGKHRMRILYFVFFSFERKSCGVTVTRANPFSIIH